MLTLFKGELSYEEFMHKMTYKEMRALRDARVQQLIDEKEREKKDADARQREMIQNQILGK